MTTEREFWRFTWLCLRVLWLDWRVDRQLPIKIWLTIYTVVMFSWKRYFYVQ